MDKYEISKRVLKNGQPLDVTKFEWIEEKNLFKTQEPFLTIDFSDLHDMNITIGDASTLIVWNDSNITCGKLCTLICGLKSQITSGSDCNIDAGLGSKIKAQIGTIIISRDSVGFAKIVANTGSEIIDEDSVGTEIIIPYIINEAMISNEPVEFTTKIKLGGKTVEVTEEQFNKIYEIIKHN